MFWKIKKPTIKLYESLSEVSDKLEIDPLTLINAFVCGIYWKTQNGTIRESKIEFYQLNVEHPYFIMFEGYKTEDPTYKIYLKDYGKTWSLTIGGLTK